MGGGISVMFGACCNEVYVYVYIWLVLCFCVCMVSTMSNKGRINKGLQLFPLFCYLLTLKRNCSSFI